MVAINNNGKPQLLSILMPVYNEYPYVKKVVERVLDTPLPDGLAREVVIVDDCSTDGTASVLEELAGAHPESVRVYRQDRNQGKGAAIRRAVAEMRGDIAIFQDADLEYDPHEYRGVLEPILEGYADVVYGSRFAASPRRRVLNYHHAVGNKLLTMLSNLCTGLNLTDMETCYKAFRADVLRTIPIRSNRFGIEPEITAKIAKRKCVVYEVPISYYGRTYSEGKKIGWVDGVRALGTILRYSMVDDCFEERYGHAILAELSKARRFSTWMTQVIEPYLGNRILETGSGIGNISRQLPKRARLTLTDYDEQYLGILDEAFRHYEAVDVHKLDLTSDEHFGDLAGQYDSVVCLNVLEHIEDDVAALRRMSGLLAPGGRLIILVPQYEWLMSRMDRDLGHFRRYTHAGLAKKMRGVGLEVDASINFNALGMAGWLINNRLLGRTSLGRYQLKVYDSLVPLMRPYERWCPHPGLSLITVGKKP